MSQATKETPQIAMTPCDSSQIHSHGHCPVTNTLALQFKGKDGPGSVYHYANFSKNDYDAFIKAPSKGKHFGAHIKKETVKHPFTKIAPHPAVKQHGM